MARSTAKFIAYDLRPAKQSERRILMEVLKTGSNIGLPISDYRYVGMGANRFYDFMLIHKYLGISKMVSLEHDPIMHKRAKYNNPYSFIEVLNTDTTSFIAEDRSEEPTIYWLDYDGGIGGPIVRDILALGAKLKVGDFCFITVFGGPPKILEKKSSSERHAWFREYLGEVSINVEREDLENANFPDAVFKILVSSFQNASSPRRDGSYMPLLHVEYSDSSPMITVGGALLQEGQNVAYRQKLMSSMPFLKHGLSERYEIGSLNVTERERHLLDRAATHPKKRNVDRNKLLDIGFSDKDISTYKDLVRFFPRYVETMV